MSLVFYRRPQESHNTQEAKKEMLESIQTSKSKFVKGATVFFEIWKAVEPYLLDVVRDLGLLLKDEKHTQTKNKLQDMQHKVQMLTVDKFRQGLTSCADSLNVLANLAEHVESGYIQQVDVLLSAEIQDEVEKINSVINNIKIIPDTELHSSTSQSQDQLQGNYLLFFLVYFFNEFSAVF